MLPSGGGGGARGNLRGDTRVGGPQLRGCLCVDLGVTGALTAMLLLFDRPALSLFLGAGSPAVDLARHIQFLASWSYILFGVTTVLFGTMRAGGVVIAPLIVLGVAMYPARLGFYWLAYPHIGADALWLSFPVGSLMAMLLAIVAYRRPGWRAKARAVPDDECAEDAQADSDGAGRLAPVM